MFLPNLVPWPPIDMQIKFDWDRPRRTPPSGELNTRGVAEYSDFGPSVTKWLQGFAFAGPCDIAK